MKKSKRQFHFMDFGILAAGLGLCPKCVDILDKWAYAHRDTVFIVEGLDDDCFPLWVQELPKPKSKRKPRRA